jgi:upstream activation factor subunit UAF30
LARVFLSRSIRKELEAEFGVDLTEQKEFIKAEIDRAVNSLAAKDEPEDSEEEETHEETADSKRKRPSSTGSGGFRQPQHLSAAMADFMGKPSAARTEVVSAISAYVKTNSLQNPSDGREIIWYASPICMFVLLQSFIAFICAATQSSRHCWVKSV